MAQATTNDTGNQLIGHVNRALTAAGRVKIRVMSYNVAQFTNNNLANQPETHDTNGYYVSGLIRTQATYNERKKAWSELFNKVNPDILGMEEYLPKFRYDTVVNTRDAILSNFPAYAEVKLSNKNDYSGKALYSTLPIESYTYKDHDAQKPNMTVRNASNYVVADINIFGITVKFVVVHLTYTADINSTDGDVREAQMNEVMNIMQNEPYVIIAGDYNVYSSSEYDRFIGAGYKVANHGYLGDIPSYTGTPSSPGESVALDNIIVKGFDISNIHVEDAAIYRDINGVNTRYPLSDHNPIWCDLLMKL